jgi:hypothetical protein
MKKIEKSLSSIVVGDLTELYGEVKEVSVWQTRVEFVFEKDSRIQRRKLNKFTNRCENTLVCLVENLNISSINNYDVDYIKSGRVDFSKIEENHIKDLMLDGHELEYLLTLNHDELDSLMFKDEFEDEDWNCDSDEFFGCLNDEFIPEIPYSEDEEEKISLTRGNITQSTIVNMRKIKDHLNLWELDYIGLSKWEMFVLYSDNLVLF